MRARRFAALAAVLLAAACGKLGPPVRASHARAPSAVAPALPAGEPEAGALPAPEGPAGKDREEDEK